MIADALAEILALPRTEQPAALRRLRASLSSADEPEAWNSRFGPGSLFDAWTRSTIVRGLHRENAAVLRRELSRRHSFLAVELGGGDGRLWAEALPPDARGELLVIDPEPEVEARVAAHLPEGVLLRFLPARIEDHIARGGGVPICDVVVSSLTLHHVAGRDAQERQDHGIPGPGKHEVLEAIALALRPRDGLFVLNEADVHCEIDLPAGDPLLEDRLLDSYVRRCAPALLHDIATRPDADDDLRRRWAAVVLHWCIEQVDRAALPVDQRDVFELDVPRWRALLASAGLSIEHEVFTDRFGLFRQYLLRPARPDAPG